MSIELKFTSKTDFWLVEVRDVQVNSKLNSIYHRIETTTWPLHNFFSRTDFIIPPDSISSQTGELYHVAVTEIK